MVAARGSRGRRGGRRRLSLVVGGGGVGRGGAGRGGAGRDSVPVGAGGGAVYSTSGGGLVEVAGGLCRRGLGLLFVVVVWRRVGRGRRWYSPRGVWLIGCGARVEEAGASECRLMLELWMSMSGRNLLQVRGVAFGFSPFSLLFVLSCVSHCGPSGGPGVSLIRDRVGLECEAAGDFDVSEAFGAERAQGGVFLRWFAGYGDFCFCGLV